jgi:GWxTD domain-containing protein
VSTPRRLLAAFWILVLVHTAVYGAAPAEKDWNSPSRDWYQGPVRYLLNTDEEKTYRALKTEEERRKFIEDFWARRDEDASTPVNEFELRFKNRVQEANDLFRDAPYPGWKTDRGKFYVLIGPPDEIRQDHFTNRRGKEIFYVIWIYHEPRFPGMERDTQVRLVRDDSGQYEATDRLALDRVERYFDTPHNLALGASSAQRPPEPRDLLDTIAASRPDKDSQRFHTRYDFFLAADGSTSVVLTLGILRSDPEPDWKVYARLSNGAASFDLAGVDSFRTSPLGSNVDGFRLYQGRISVPPGLYSVFFGIQNGATRELFSLSERLTVPDFREGNFALSGITLAAKLELVSNPESDPPFLVGRLLVIPKMEAVYKTGADLAYYFQVYHPGTDPETGDASLDLTYQVLQAASLQKTGQPAYEPMGKPLFFENQAGLVHGYAFPLTGWPAGEFMLQINAKDRVTGRTSRAEARFSVR